MVSVVDDDKEERGKVGVLVDKMEAAGLYDVAAEFGVNALAVLSISDHIRTGEAT